MKRHICTYFDINFLPRGMALLDSLEKNSEDFLIYILALDEEVVKYFLELNNPNVKIITLAEYSKYFSISKEKYQDKKEFYFSLTPAICLYVLKVFRDVDLILYLDADVYLFNDLEIIYDEIGTASVAMCSQRLPWYNSKKYGLYNVGVNAFRRDNVGIKCLEDWHEDCSSWEKGQKNYKLDFFSDQIWLDQWPKKYNNLKVIEHIGIDTAPWNAIQYRFTKREHQYYIDDKPLVLYHFSSIKQLTKHKWHLNTTFTIFNLQNSLADIYKEYIKNIIKYDSEKTDDVIKLTFSGNKLKNIVYSVLKIFHKHTITIK